MKTITDQIKKAIWDVLKENSTADCVTLQPIPQKLRNVHGIEWKEYVENIGPGEFKRWLLSMFPLIEDPKNGNRVFLSESAAAAAVKAEHTLDGAAAEKIEGILRANLNAEGYLLNSEIPHLLEKEENGGIKWRDLAGSGATLGRWIENTFPVFRVDTEGKAPCIRLKHTQEYGPEGNTQGREYPVSFDPESVDSASEIQDMHTFAFMGYWSTNVGSLKRLTGCTGSNQDIWRGIVAHQLAVAKLNLEGATYLDASSDEVPRIAFYTGFQTADGKNLYGIFVPNELGPQKWRLSGYCYPGQEGDGQWLCRRFNIRSEDEEAYSQTYEELQSLTGELKKAQERLQGCITFLTQDILDGRKIQNETEECLSQYQMLWTQAEKALYKLNPGIGASCTLHDLEAYVEGNEAYYEMLDGAVTLFGQFLSGLHAWMEAERLPVQAFEASVLGEDARRIEAAYRNKNGAEDEFSAFYETLSVYKDILFLMENDVLSEEVLDAADRVSSHLGIAPRLLRAVFVGAGKQEFSGQIHEIETILSRCVLADGRKQSLPEQSRKIEHPVPELLSQSVQKAFALDNDGEKERLKQLFCAENEFEKLIIMNRFAEASALAADEERMGELGYRETEIAHAYSVLRYGKKMSGSLKEYFCGLRLLELQGNKNRQAEKYLLLADKTNNTVLELLNILRREGRTADFTYVFEAYADVYDIDFTNKSFLLQSYGQNGSYDTFLLFLNRHPELAYDAANLDWILPVLAQAGEMALYRELEERSEFLENQPLQNDFETALINCDMKEIGRLSMMSEELQTYGYTVQECEEIENCVRMGEYPDQTGRGYDYETGCRIYAFQKNKHALAEQFLWKGLNRSSLLAQCGTLFKILAGEQRWRECCALYEAYEPELSKSEEARKHYLMALLYTDAPKACEKAEKNLLDFLSEELMELLKQQAADETCRTLYGKLQSVLGKIENDFVKSVVFVEPELRNYIMNPDMPGAYDFSREERELMVAAYKNDMFPYGSDALSIAKRVYTFCGNRGGLAQELAQFALPDMEAAVFLDEIYVRNREYEKQFALFEQIPELADLRRGEYAQLLFLQGKYQEFLVLYGQFEGEERSDILDLEERIARLSKMPEVQIEMETLLAGRAGEILAQEDKLQMEFVNVLARRRAYEALAFLHRFCFEEILNKGDSGKIERFLTDDGWLDHAYLEYLQEQCIEPADEALALYLYNVFGIGDKKELAEQYYRELMQETECVSVQERLARIERLYKLYPKQKQELFWMEFTARFEILTAQEKTGGERLCSLYEHYRTQETAVSAFALYGAYVTEQIQKQKYDDVLTEFLCMEFNRLLVQGVSCEERIDLAKQIARSCMERTGSCRAAYTLYRIYTLEGHRRLAELAFAYVNESPYAELGEEINEWISNDILQRGSAGTKTLMEILKEELMDPGSSDLRNFMQEAKCFVRPGQRELEFAQSIGEEYDTVLYSEDESECLLRLLFANPDSVRFWKACVGLPLQTEPEIYARILYYIAKTGAGSWLTCLEYCSKYEFEELIFCYLDECLANAPDEGTVIECQKFAAKLERETDYLQTYADKERLRSIVRLLCDTYQADDRSHESLRAISQAAIAAGMEDVLLAKLTDALVFGDSVIGSAAAARMLLKNSTDNAYMLIQKLAGTLSMFHFRPFVEKLSGLSREELSVKSGDPVTRRVLEFMLPDGNRPGVERIQEYACDALLTGQSPAAAAVLAELLQIFPEDIGLFSAMYLVCKEPFEGYEPYLQKSLYGLGILPQGNDYAKHFYRLEELPYRKWFAMSSVLQEEQGGESLIDDYVSEEKTGTFLMKHNSLATNQEIIELNAFHDQIRVLFDNRSEIEKQRLRRMLHAAITGSWTEVLRQLYSTKTELQPYGELFAVSSDGFFRSMLQLMQEMEREEQISFEGWLAAGGCFERRPKLRKRLHTLKEAEIFAFPELGKYLSWPLEDFFMHNYLQEHLYRLSDPVWTREVYLLAGVFTMEPEVAKSMMKQAEEAFGTGRDAQAYAWYYVLRALGKLGVYHNSNPRLFRLLAEQYESRMRLAGCFAGVESIVQKVSSESFHSWSCANMVLQLLMTVRANEVNHLKQYLSAANRKLCDALLICVNRQMTDAYKIAAVRAAEQPDIRMILCMVLTFEKGGYLKQEEGKAEVRRIMAETMRDSAGKPGFEGGRFYPLVNVPPRLDSFGLTQRAEQEFVHVPVTEAGQERKVPEFVRQAEQLCGTEQTENWESDDGEERIAALLERYRLLPVEANEERLELSKEMYLAAKCRNWPKEKTDDMILRWGVDLYRAVLDRAVLFETARYSRFFEKEGEGFRRFREIGSSALFHVLNGYEQVTDLVNDYKNYRDAFWILMETQEETLVREVVESLYRILDQLVAVYTSAAANDTAAMQNRLKEVYRRFEEMRYSREWSEIKNRMQTLLNREINRLSRSPILVCSVLNEGENTAAGRLYGEMYNIGRERADQILIQAVYNGERYSQKYQLNMLYPENKAAFEIDYLVPENEAELRYTIFVTYEYKGESCSAESISGTLTLSPKRTYQIPELPYDTGTIVSFRATETGEVVSDALIGREAEKDKFRRTFSGEFVNYRDTIVRGVRRAGKTSMLNYAIRYVEKNCPDCIPLYIDCQGIASSQYIQDVFINKVLNGLEMLQSRNNPLLAFTMLSEDTINRLAEIIQSSRWTSLGKRWKLSEEQKDRNPSELERFYFDLVETLQGMRLILFVDEIDTLFERVAAVQGLDASLFPSLGAILCSMNMRSLIHFVFCGSNQLIRYGLDGGVLNQFFQRFGNVIEIGRLTAQDVNRMLHNFGQEESELIYSESALEWIWHFTGGLAWHTKLLGQVIVQRLKAENRNIVYPSDVCYAMSDVATAAYCRQFLEGCETVEKKILDAMQSLSGHEGEYILADDIASMLENQYPKKTMDAAFELLIRLDLLERRTIENTEAYRFTLELYRQYFRSELSFEYTRTKEAGNVFTPVLAVRRKKY